MKTISVYLGTGPGRLLLIIGNYQQLAEGWLSVNFACTLCFLIGKLWKEIKTFWDTGKMKLWTSRDTLTLKLFFQTKFGQILIIDRIQYFFCFALKIHMYLFVFESVSSFFVMKIHVSFNKSWAWIYSIIVLLSKIHT